MRSLQSLKQFSFHFTVFYYLCLMSGLNSVLAKPYYIDGTNGNDNINAANLSPSQAWRTFNNVNSHGNFNPGDSILIRRGTTIYSTISPYGNGSARAPIVISSYVLNSVTDIAKPIIDAQDAANNCITLDNLSYWTIQNLDLRNALIWGICVSSSQNALIRNIKIINNTIHDVGSEVPIAVSRIIPGGIFVTVRTTLNPIMGKLDSVIIQDNQLHHILGWGIFVEGQNYAIIGLNSWVQNWAQIWSNLSTHILVHGNSIIATNGNGIIVVGADNPVIEYNFVDSAGWLSPQNGADAEQTTCCRKGLIQYNEVCHTYTAGDANALHTDQGESDTCIFQYNYSHDNAGSFFNETWPAIYDDPNHRPVTIVRYNISQNDNNYYSTTNAEPLVGLNLGGSQFYNNTLYNTKSISIKGIINPSQFNPSTDTGEGLPRYAQYDTIRNNIFYGASSSTPATWDDAYPYQHIYDHNFYYNVTSVPSWGNTHMVSGNAALANPGSGPAGYRLLDGSTCINTGVSIRNSNNIQDYWGTRLYVGLPDIGAYEKFSLTGAAAIEKIPGTGQVVCFAVGTDSSVHYRIQKTAGANNDWPDAWNSLGGPVTGPIAAIKGSDSALYVFAKNSGNVLQYRRLPYGSIYWEAWKKLASVTIVSGKNVPVQIGSKIAVAAYSDNNIAIFARGATDNYLYLLNQTGSNAFSSSWVKMGNTTIGNNIVIGMVSRKYLQLFANRYSGNSVVSLYQTAAGSGGAWTSTYRPLYGDASGGLAVGNNANDTLQIFTTSASTGVIATSYRTSSGWTPWQNMPGLSGFYAGQNMTCAKNPDGRLELFFWGYKGSLVHMYQLSVNGYLSWSGTTNFQYTGGGGPTGFIGAINNAASSWNISLFVYNGSTINFFYQNCNYYDCWAPPLVFNN